MQQTYDVTKFILNVKNNKSEHKFSLLINKILTTRTKFWKLFLQLFNYGCREHCKKRASTQANFQAILKLSKIKLFLATPDINEI